MTTDGLPGFPRDRVCPDIMGRDVSSMSERYDSCDGGSLPSVRDGFTEPGHSNELAADRDGPPSVSSSLAEQARVLVDGERQSAYGEPVEHMRRVADAWSAVLSRPFTPEEVCLCLATLKLVREGYRAKRDNREDAVGYLDILERVHNYR